jgi:preprotein translocase subunit YajC
MADSTGITATTAAPGAPGAAPTQNPLVSLTPVLFIGVIFYFLLMRPQQKQQKEHRRMLDALKPGDRVLTQGGIYGTISNLKGNVVVLKIADNVKVEVSRTAIAQVIVETSNGTPAPSSPKEVVG